MELWLKVDENATRLDEGREIRRALCIQGYIRNIGEAPL